MFKGHVWVSQSQPEVNLFRNALWLPNLIRSVGSELLGLNVMQGSTGVKIFLNGYHIWSVEPLTTFLRINGNKGQ